jgi:hypothetical protein
MECFVNNRNEREIQYRPKSNQHSRSITTRRIRFTRKFSLLLQLRYLLLWAQLAQLPFLGQQSSKPLWVTVQGQIISVIPAVTTISPSTAPSASPTVYSIKVPPLPTAAPVVTPPSATIPVAQATISPAPVPAPIAQATLSPAPAPVPIVQATIPPWLRPSPPTIQPSVVPTITPSNDVTNVPTSAPIASITLVTDSPTVAGGFSLIKPTPNVTTNLDSGGTDSDPSNSNKKYLKIFLPIIGVVLFLILNLIGIYYTHRPTTARKKRKESNRYHLPLSESNGNVYELNDDFDPNRPDGNSAFDDSSLYTSSVGISVGTSSNMKDGRHEKNKRLGGNSSTGVVINQDYTDTTEIENEDMDDDDDDDDDDHAHDATSEVQTENNSTISGVTPNTIENYQIGYMEEGIMIQQRYNDSNNELYASERIMSDRNNVNDSNIQDSQTRRVAQSLRDSKLKGLSPSHDQGIEIIYKNDKTNRALHYDDIVGVDNTSMMSYDNSSAERPKHPTTGSIASGKIYEILNGDDNIASMEQLKNFDDPQKSSKPNTNVQQPQGLHPLSTISLFKRGKGNKNMNQNEKSNKATVLNNTSQYKKDDPYHMTVPAVVDPTNDDQNSSLVEPFSELTTDIQYDHDSIGSNEAQIVVLESIKEGSKMIYNSDCNDHQQNITTISSSCDSSVNNTHVYETDTDSNASRKSLSKYKSRNNTDELGHHDYEYNMNLPLDYNTNVVNDDGSANSQFDKLYESMSNQWEWKDPSQTIGAAEAVGVNDDERNDTKGQPSPTTQLQQNLKKTNSAEDIVRDLDNIFLV